MMKRILRSPAILVASAMALLYMMLALAGRDRTTLRSAKVAWLPPHATEVSQRVREGLGAAEFVECTIPEADFLELANAKGWKVEEQEDVWASLRITELGPLRNDPEYGPVDLIRKAYVAQKRAPNGGGYSVWYDRELRRMIYQWSSR
jgi:hypothetical protein